MKATMSTVSKNMTFFRRLRPSDFQAIHRSATSRKTWINVYLPVSPLKSSVQSLRLYSTQSIRLQSTDADNNNKAAQSTVSTTPTTWVESSYIPKSWRPYLYLARVDKPIGTMLLFWPCCWSVALAAPMGALPDLLLMGKFFAGAFIMRGAGCTINDLWDRDFDGKVERTKTRPLASGALKPIQALTFLGGQLLTGLGILLTFNQASIITAMASMPLVVIYPLMKRYTHCPQLILGMTFNWGAWVGWTAVHDSINVPLLTPLYTAGICWTLVYDTLYGYQDRKDDAQIGVKSFALFLGDKPQLPFTAIATGMIGGLLYTGHLADLSSWYYMGILGQIAPMMLHQIWTADLDNPKNLWDKFKSNNLIGASITAWIAAGHFPGLF